nr:MAG TPA: hypothetical protein [Caudoviricetes sp.]
MTDSHPRCAKGKLEVIAPYLRHLHAAKIQQTF